MTWIVELAELRAENEALREKVNAVQQNGHKSKPAAPKDPSVCLECRSSKKQAKKLEAEVTRLGAQLAKLKEQLTALEEQLVSESSAREDAEERAEAAESKLKHFAMESGEISLN